MKEFTSRIVRGNFPLCFEKARLITESHKKTEGEPAIIRYAKAHANVLENIPVIIDKEISYFKFCCRIGIDYTYASHAGAFSSCYSYNRIFEYNAFRG